MFDFLNYNILYQKCVNCLFCSLAGGSGLIIDACSLCDSPTASGSGVPGRTVG